jgi:hypothetical protein
VELILDPVKNNPASNPVNGQFEGLVDGPVDGPDSGSVRSSVRGPVKQRIRKKTKAEADSELPNPEYWKTLTVRPFLTICFFSCREFSLTPALTMRQSSC